MLSSLKQTSRTSKCCAYKLPAPLYISSSFIQGRYKSLSYSQERGTCQPGRMCPTSRCRHCSVWPGVCSGHPRLQNSWQQKGSPGRPKGILALRSPAMRCSGTASLERIPKSARRMKRHIAQFSCTKCRFGEMVIILEIV